MSFTNTVVAQTESEVVAYLKQLDFAQMVTVEVTLDEAFNVFDGLVKAQKVSVATGLTQTRQQAPAITSVITRQDIEAIGARDLDEALEMVPGLHVGKAGINNNSIYTMRGIHTNANPEVLLMINGTPFKSVTSGNRGIAWGGFPVQSIDRIEVIRGTGSALYGADAFAGVINVITRQGHDIQGTEVGVQAGSFDTQAAWLVHGDVYQDLEVAATLEVSDTDGYAALIEEDAQTQWDRRLGTNASRAPDTLNTGHRNVDAHLELNYHNLGAQLDYNRRDDLGTNLGLGQALDPVGKNNSERVSGTLSYQQENVAPDWDVFAKLNVQRMEYTPEDLQVYPPNAFGGLFPDGFYSYFNSAENQAHVSLSGFYHGIDKHIVRVGVGYDYEALDEWTSYQNYVLDADFNPIPLGSTQALPADQAILSPHTRRNQYLFLQDSWQLAPDWELTSGVRYDDYSDFGSTINPRFALVWDTTSRLTSKLLYGQAFRAPSFLELYLEASLLGLGNPNLEPEEIEMWELAFDYLISDKVHTAFNVFRYQIDNKIGYPNGQLQAENSEQQTGYGFETELRWKMTARSSLLMNYAWQKSEDGQGLAIPDAWGQTFFARVDWLVQPNWYLDSTLRWVGGRHRSATDTRPQIEDYTLVDLTLRRKEVRTGHWNAALGIRNVFDQDAREPTTVGIGVTYDLPLPRRHWFVELRYRF